MKFLVAIDSYKGSLTSGEAGEAACRGILSAYPDALVKVVPVSDGGDGMLDAFVTALNGSIIPVETRDAMMRRISAKYGAVDDIAIVEVAQSIGLSIIRPEERNALLATSYGVGLMLADAVIRGYKHFIIGLGGTATSDAGIGMLRALIDKLGKFGTISTFDDIRKKYFSGTTFLLASDVQNPLLGKEGAAHVFAPQKGASSNQVEQIEQRVKKFAEMSSLHAGYDCSNTPGAGAAGGLGYAFMQFFNATTVSGADFLLDRLRFDQMISECDYIVTGEGHSDSQTLMGKLPFVILQRAKKMNKPVLLVSGGISDEPQLCAAGFSSIVSISDNNHDLAYNMRPEIAKNNMARMIKSICRNQQK